MAERTQAEGSGLYLHTAGLAGLQRHYEAWGRMCGKGRECDLILGDRVHIRCKLHIRHFSRINET